MPHLTPTEEASLSSLPNFLNWLRAQPPHRTISCGNGTFSPKKDISCPSCILSTYIRDTYPHLIGSVGIYSIHIRPQFSFVLENDCQSIHPTWVRFITELNDNIHPSHLTPNNTFHLCWVRDCILTDPRIHAHLKDNPQ